MHAYPSGGGDYEVATSTSGPKAGLTVASALLVDYVLTVAVSVSSGVQNAGVRVRLRARARGAVRRRRSSSLLTAMNLRGVRESGAAFAIPVYLFMVGVIGMAVVGFFRQLTGDLPPAESAGLELLPEPGYEALGGLAAGLPACCGRSRPGCAALTGVEAISNGVPAFQKPKSKNAATTLLLHGRHRRSRCSLSILALARWTGVKYRRGPGDPADPRRRAGRRRATCRTP